MRIKEAGCTATNDIAIISKSHRADFYYTETDEDDRQTVYTHLYFLREKMLVVKNSKYTHSDSRYALQIDEDGELRYFNHDNWTPIPEKAREAYSDQVGEEILLGTKDD